MVVGKGVVSGVEENKAYDMEEVESHVLFCWEVWRMWLVNCSSEAPTPPTQEHVCKRKSSGKLISRHHFTIANVQRSVVHRSAAQVVQQRAFCSFRARKG
jgi:hypothetical protein